MDKLLVRKVLYITLFAQDWNSETNRFDTLCAGQACVGSTGEKSAGTVSTGILEGNGAGVPVAFVGGDTNTKIQRGANSIPSSWTICSITRYSSSSNQKRILSALSNPLGNKNWCHGHLSKSAGTVYYDQGIYDGISYNIDTKTDWVVACGRSLSSTGKDGVIVNGVITRTTWMEKEVPQWESIMILPSLALDNSRDYTYGILSYQTKISFWPRLV